MAPLDFPEGCTPEQQRRCLHLLRKMVLRWQNRKIKESCKTTGATARARRQLMLDRSQLVDYPCGAPGQVERYTPEQIDKLRTAEEYKKFRTRLDAGATERSRRRHAQALAEGAQAKAVGAARARKFIQQLSIGRSAMNIQLQLSLLDWTAAYEEEAAAGEAAAEQEQQEAAEEAAAEEEEAAAALADARLQPDVRPADDHDRERALALGRLEEDDAAEGQDDAAVLADEDGEAPPEDGEAPPGDGAQVSRPVLDAAPVCQAKLRMLQLTGEVIDLCEQAPSMLTLALTLSRGLGPTLTLAT